MVAPLDGAADDESRLLAVGAGRSGAARGARLDLARGVRHVGRFAGALRLFLRRSFPRIDSRRSESGIGGDERDVAAIVVVPPDGVIALGADLLNLCA